MTYVNLGGGFGIPYFEKDHPLDLTRVAENLNRLLTQEIHPNLPGAKPSSSSGDISSASAASMSPGSSIENSRAGGTHLVVDGGMHHQLAASGNFGQVIRRNYPLAIGNRMTSLPTSRQTVVGCLCTPLDLLGDDTSCPAPRSATWLSSSKPAPTA